MFEFSFFSASPETWNRKMTNEEIETIVATSILLDSEILERTLGFYKPAKRIREIRMTAAALDQIAYSWWGKRDHGAQSPPTIPLKYYVYGLGQKPPDTWVDVEVLPGVDEWE